MYKFSDVVVLLIVGMLIGWWLTVVTMNCYPPMTNAMLVEARGQCEKSLPRDQHCVYQFIPEKDKQ
jgi:hypothetical protein